MLLLAVGSTEFVRDPSKSDRGERVNHSGYIPLLLHYAIWSSTFSSFKN